MKHQLLALLVVSLGLSVHAQEPVSRAEALKFAAIANFDLDKIADTPLPTDGDIKRAFAVKAGKRGALVIPETKLSAATIAGAGKEPVSVGQLWFAGVVPSRDGQAVAKEQLKMVTVEYEGNATAIPLCVLGVRKPGGGGAQELLIYGKGKEPILTLPLKPATHDQKMPIELSAEREGDSGRVTVMLFGKYEASFLVAEREK